MSKKKYKARNPTPRGKSTIEVKNTGYDGGGASRTTGVLKAWNPVKSSAKSDINAHLDILRSRAADQAINTPVGSAAIATTTQYTVGAGLKVFPKVKYQMLDMSPEEAESWNKQAAMEFNLWASSKLCDIRKRNNFYDLQEILYKAYMTDGDSFAVFRRAYDINMPYTLRIQAIEGNRVSNPQGRDYYGITGPQAVEMAAPNGRNKIINGVEVDSNGAVEAYWISNKVPFDPVEINMATTWARVEAFGDILGRPNVLHICHDERPEQYRGVPYLAPVIKALKQISRYSDAELAAAILRSYFTLFFTSVGSSSVAGDVSSILGASAYNGVPGDNDPVVDASEYRLGPGTINALPKNIDVKSIGATGGQATFDSFMTVYIKMIAAALNIPYEVLMKSFNSSYSASRAALLQAWEQFRLRRAWFSRDFCQPVYEMWLTEAVATGRIEAPDFFSDPAVRFAYCNAEWYGPSMSILDPVKDVNGSTLRIQCGLSTHEREAAEMTGSDFYENLETLRIEKQRAVEAGIALSTQEAPGTQGGAMPTEEGGENDGKDDEEKDTQRPGN